MSSAPTHARRGDGPELGRPRGAAVGNNVNKDPLTGLPPRWRSDLLVHESVSDWREFTATGDAEAVLIDYLSPRGIRGWLGLGDPARLAELVERVAGANDFAGPDDFAGRDDRDDRAGAAGTSAQRLSRPVGLTVTAGTWELLTPATCARLAMPHRDSWDWLAITHPVPDDRTHPALRARVRVLNPADSADADAIAGVQAAAIPDTHLKVDAPGTRWFGLSGPGGDIRAIAGAMKWPDAAHLGSVATLPGDRGRGYGSALTAAIVDAGLDLGLAQVSLGAWADNSRALAMYHRLGFETHHQFTTHRAAPRAG